MAEKDSLETPSAEDSADQHLVRSGPGQNVDRMVGWVASLHGLPVSDEYIHKPAQSEPSEEGSATGFRDMAEEKDTPLAPVELPERPDVVDDDLFPEPEGLPPLETVEGGIVSEGIDLDPDYPDALNPLG